MSAILKVIWVLPMPDWLFFLKSTGVNLLNSTLSFLSTVRSSALFSYFLLVFREIHTAIGFLQDDWNMDSLFQSKTVFTVDYLEKDEFIKAYRSISAQLKKKFVRKPNITDAVDGFGR